MPQAADPPVSPSASSGPKLPVPIVRRANAQAPLSRCFTVLSALAGRAQPLTLAELSRATDIPKSTLHRLVGSLVDSGVVERDGHSYVLGLQAFEFGCSSAPGTLRERARPLLQLLQARTRLGVHLAVLHGVDVVSVERFTGPGMPILGHVGRRRPAHISAVGKAMLAFAAPELVEERIDRGLTRCGPQTITNVRALRDELAGIKARGFAMETEESNPAVECIAAPVRSREGDVIAAVSVCGVHSQMTDRTAAPLVKNFAARISAVIAQPLTAAWR